MFQVFFLQELDLTGLDQRMGFPPEGMAGKMVEGIKAIYRVDCIAEAVGRIMGEAEGRKWMNDAGERLWLAVRDSWEAGYHGSGGSRGGRGRGFGR